MHPPPHPPAAAWALVFAALGCQAPVDSLPDIALDPSPPGDELPLPLPLPDPGDADCAERPTLAPGPAELACAVIDAPLRVTERLDATGCVVERITHTLDDRGHALRTARAVFDARAIAHLSPYEAPSDHVITRTFDARDRLVQRRRDGDADGVFEQTWRWVYADGAAPADPPAAVGPEEQVWTEVFDADGRRVMTRSQVADRMTEQRYSYDADGHEARIETWSDGALAGLWTQSRDAEGRPIEEIRRVGARVERAVNRYGAHGLAATVSTRDEGERRVVTTETAQTRRPDGTLARQQVEERWFNGNGSREVSTYGADEEPQRVERDEDLDGRVDSIRERWLEDGGLTVVYRTTSGQRVTAHSEQRFDAAGRRLGVLDVLSGAGVRFERDAAGREVEVVHFGEGGLAHRVYRYRYAGDPARSSRRETDADADGVVDHVLLTEHDAAGRRVRQRADEDADGRWDMTSTWHHDRAGRLVYAAEGVTDDPACGPELHTVQAYRCD